METEVEVWRQLCRQANIRDALEMVAPLLADSLGVRLILVRRLDHDARRLETIATSGLRGGGPQPEGRTGLPVGAFLSVVSWIRRREILFHDVEAHRDLLALLTPRGLDGRASAVPLPGLQQELGVVLLEGENEDSRSQRTDQLKRLAEPFAAALENSERIRELTRLREALEADRLALLSRLQREDISEAVVGAESGLAEVMHRVRQVAGTDAPVLINGETGSGKEVIARALHDGSARSEGPMLKVNCGAIPPGLVDSELFGHERGSFTGARARHRGWFERADGGTLFLDEVAELSPAAQVRLLRVLQDGTLVRVGGHEPIQVDVRIVAATHRQLDEMVLSGTMREDLFYRISVFPILLPPLRERRDDIPDLAAHFAWRAGKRLMGRPLSPSPENIRRLLDYDWPGNVRELAAVIERAAILGDGRRLEIDAALGGFGGVPARSQWTPTRPRTEPGAGSPILPLDDAIVGHLEQALRSTGGRIEGPMGAAALLGVNPHTLRSRMRRLGLDWKRFRQS